MFLPTLNCHCWFPKRVWILKSFPRNTRVRKITACSGRIHITVNVRIDRAAGITFHNWLLFLFTATIFDFLFSTRPYDNLKSQTVPKQGEISVWFNMRMEQGLLKDIKFESALPAKITRSASFKASLLRCRIWRLLFLPRRPRAIPPRKHGMPSPYLIKNYWIFHWLNTKRQTTRVKGLLSHYN